MKRPDQMRTLAALGAVAGFFLIAGAGGIAWSDSTWGHGLFAQICHQNADRCLTIGGTAMAICARCVGIYAGLAMGCAAYWSRSGWQLVSRGIRGIVPWLIIGIAVLLNLLDFVMEQGGLYENAIPVRLAVGWLLGLALPLFVFSRARAST